MSTLVKKQHYVWRSYLKPWSIKECGKQICTYYIDENKICATSLMNIAQERFFYEIQPLSDSELIAAQNFINQFPAFVRPYAANYLSAHTIVSKKLMTDDEKHEFAKNFYEKEYTRMEQYGYNLLNCKNVEDLKQIENLDQCIFYLCVQYGRTKKMRMNGVIGLKERPLDSLLYDKLFPLTTIISAAILGCNLYLSPTTQYTFIKNETGIPFLTSDQPAINLVNDDLDEDGHVKDFELYYPTSPSTAIMVSWKSGKEKYSEKIVNEEYVKFLNDKICKNALSYIFANSIENLSSIKFK